MPAAHPNNIFGEMSVNRRLTETGGRNFTQDANDYRLVQQVLKGLLRTVGTGMFLQLFSFH